MQTSFTVVISFVSLHELLMSLRSFIDTFSEETDSGTARLHNSRTSLKSQSHLKYLAFEIFAKV